jgi:hypothetical protein
MIVILATQDMGGRFQDDPCLVARGQNTNEVTFQPKTGYGGTCLSSHLHKRPKEKDCSPDKPGKKQELLLEI